jgi:MFS family permease
MTVSAPVAWVRVALVMFAVGWGANQFSPMLIVYRHSLGLSPGEIAGLFAIYAATLIPGLLAGGPLSDRFGRRVVVLPFAALSPVATLLLVLGPHSLPLIAAGRALAGLCSGMVFGPATAWVQDLSRGDPRSARRAALALSAGFGLGPVVAALLAQWAADPLVVPYLPHLALGAAALAVGLTAPATAGAARPVKPAVRRAARAGHRLPAALRGRAFWLGVAPAAPFVFGCASLAIVVLPEEVTSARTLSAGYAGLMTALTFAAGIGVQPAARRLAARRPQAGLVAGLGCAAAGAAAGAAAVSAAGASAAPHGPGQLLAGLAAALLGLGFGLCLVSGLSQAEQLTGPDDRGTVLAAYYVLAYLGFAAPYTVAGLNLALGKPGTFAAAAGAAALLTGLTWLQAALPRRADPPYPGQRVSGRPWLRRRLARWHEQAAAPPRAETGSRNSRLSRTGCSCHGPQASAARTGSPRPTAPAANPSQGSRWTACRAPIPVRQGP